MKLKSILFLLISIFLLENISVYANEEVNTNVNFDIAYGSLKAIDESFSPDLGISEVTRGEFIKNIVSVIGIAEVTDGKMPFEDVVPGNEYYNAVLSALHRNWISEGDMFYPDEKITVEQALKIGVHAIGGGEHAQYYGGWSEGYWAVAQKCDLLKNVSISQNNTLSSEQMCILLYNILTSATYDFELTNDRRPQIVPEGDSLLCKIYDMYIYEGTVTANTLTDMGDELAQRNDTVRIGEFEFYDDFGCTSYLGYNVKALYQKKDDERFLKFVIPYRTEVTQLNNHTISEVDGKTVYYTDSDGRSGRLKLDDGFSYVYNGKTKILTQSDLSAVFERETTNFIFLDNDRDKLVDVVKAEHYEYTYVDSFDLYEGLIYDKYSASALIDISDTETEYEVYLIENGLEYEASIDDIDTDIIVAVSSSEDGKYKKLMLCFDVVKGSVTKNNTEDKILTIESEEYYASSYYTNNFSIGMGSERTFLLGINNEIVADNVSGSSMKYAWLVRAFQDDDGEKYFVKVFNQNSEMLKLELAEKIYLDGVRTAGEVVFDELRTINSDNRRFIRYGVNKDGKVSKIDLTEEKINDIFAIGNNYPENNSLIMNFSGSFTTRPRYLLRDNTDRVSRFNFQYTEYIFVIPPEEARDDAEQYRLASVSELNSVSEDMRNTIMAYDTQLSGSPKAMVITAGRLLSEMGGTSKLAVVEKIQEELDNDDNPAHALYVNDGTEYSTIYMSDSVINQYGLPNEGDIISYVADYRSGVRSLNVIFDFENYQVNHSGDEANTYAGGFLYSYNNGFMYYFGADMTNPKKPAIPQTIAPETLQNTNISQDKVVFINAVRSKDGATIKDVSVVPAPMTNLMGYRNSNPSKVTYVVSHIQYCANYMTFAYNVEYR